MTGAQAIVACMKQENITKVFCVPGESYLPVLDALHDEDSMEVITARHEGGAAFMAESYAKSTLKPGVVMATRGVGASNLAIGVHTAMQDSTPVVVLLGQVHSKFSGREGFQEVDLVHYFQPISKWTVEIKDADRIPELVQRAFRIAKSGRPGPVVISLPEDVLPEVAEMRIGPVAEKPKPAPSEEEIEKTAAMLNGARQPVIIAGGGVKAAGAEELLAKFSTRCKLPVLAAFRRHDVIDSKHEMYAGHLGLGLSPTIRQTVKEADLILVLGSRLSEVTTQDYGLIEASQKMIHIDIDANTLGKVYAPDVGIVADMKEALLKLLQMDISVTWGDWAAATHDSYKQTCVLQVSKNDVLNKFVIAELAEKLPKNALLTNDAGNFAGWMHRYYPFRTTHSYVGPTSGAMGYGMPAALGAKLAFPHKTVVSLSGDGGFMMTVSELETAVRHQIHIIAIVFNNQMYGTIRMHQEMHYPERTIATDLGRVSFVQLAESMGAKGCLVTTRKDFSEAFDEALHSDCCTVIEVMTNPEQISVSATIADIRSKKK
ncbi:thiamine pyrophosphate-dependent enzyme [Virgibacillus halophilus]|uniref:thiamine pyrophosphate-dependent enzyme n=1 Tax=Tigheibacillus halophilus TaxID=361280 RepID=UPI00362BAE53